MSSSHFTATVVAAALIALSPLAGAPPAAAAGASVARRAHRLGKRLFAAGRYDEAITAFERGYREARHPNALYSIGECYRRLGRLRRSHDYYAAYAKTLAPEAREAFARKLDQLRLGQPSRLQVSTDPPGAAVLVDGQPRGHTATGAPVALEVPGGSHRVTARLAGHAERAQAVLAEFGEPIAARLVLTPLATAPAPIRSSTRAPAPRLERPRRRRLRPPRFAWGVDLLGGPSAASYGDDRLSVSVGIEAGLQGALIWRIDRRGRVGLGLRAGVLYAPVRDGVVGETASAVNLLAGAAARYYLRRDLWLALRFSVGPALLLGASPQHFLRSGGTAADGGVLGLTIRPALAVGWRLRGGLTLTALPLAIDHSPRAAGFTGLAPTIGGITRFHFAVAVGWQSAR